MIVYGDHPRATTFAALDTEAAARLAAARAAPPGTVRHTALVAAFLAAAEAARAHADADFASVGHDRRTPEADARMAVLVRLARALRVSWRTRFRHTPVPLPVPLTEREGSRVGPGPDAWPGITHPRPLPCRAGPAVAGAQVVSTKPAEGFAFYALYPEAVLDALHFPPPQRGGGGRESDGGGGPGPLPRDLAIVGLRGIGVALAALAAAATRTRRPPITLRPTGHPFAREITIDPALANELATPAAALIVDEGPGLSGSSIAAAATWLRGAGVVPDRIHLLTSHPGPPGAMASPATRALFDACPRHVASFEASIAPHLPGWVADLLGERITDWHDISGGAWTDAATPTDPPRERLKFRATAASGRYLVKFAGLGAIGEAKLARARALAGSVPPPVGLAHGFLVERWIEAGPPAPPTPAEIAAYLAARARLPQGPGADLATLIAMAHANIDEALGPHAAAAFVARAGGCARLPTSPVATDNRLHAWEWLRDANGRLFKTDALDHCEAHDLIGHQDIAWDVAGAAVELGLDPAPLARAVQADARLVALHRLLYPAFQLGLWTMTGHPRAYFYARHLRAAL